MLKQPHSTQSVTNIAVCVNRSWSEQQREPNELGEFGFRVRYDEQLLNVLPMKNSGESLRYPFLSQPSHTHGTEKVNRHKLSVIESRRVKKKTNRQTVRKKREIRQKVRESVEAAVAQ
ncbi:hypothetical protein M9H77_21240 [Catharanthus roseus]|uniref:Uncharacterized protein n=1 Tax=Catharanthus roseus TaxID=4058 RepID=A0ACC0ALQ6_CATRO|nr:hypothetical protein M9H77_21240 [Catharanthus roseus]